VADNVVDATLPHLPEVVADMVRLQRLCGCRPGEVSLIRPCDVDASGEVWVYQPESHKTEHHGRKRIICIGPKGQDVLRPYLLRPAESYCFSPQDSERKRLAEMHAKRRTPLSCGNRPGSNRTRRPKRKPGERYDTNTYRRAIHRAVDLANRARTKQAAKEGVEPEMLSRWSPNQLRHSAATAIRKAFGLEAAQVTLGHAQADVTQVYAERDLSLAVEVMRKIG
jgi:integrase